MKPVLTSTLLVAAALVMPRANAQLSSVDQQFANQAAQINMLQAHLGQMAQKQASGQDVKNFGQKLASDHNQAYQRLSQIAAKNNFTIPKAIDSQHEAYYQNLTSLNGSSFDDQVRQTEMQVSQKAMDIFKSETQQGQNSDLRNYASELSGTLNNEMQMAQNLGGDTNMNANANTMPAPTAQTAPVPAVQSAGSSDRMMPDAQAFSETHNATVIRYDPGHTLAVKVRHWIGEHVYNLSDTNLSANVPQDLKPGDQVMITESVDNNGRQMLQVQANMNQ